LDDPDKFLHGVVEVQLDLVRRRSDRLITSELELGDQIFVRILSETSSLVRVQEDVVNIQRGSHKRLVVGNSGRHRLSNSVLGGTSLRTKTRIAVQCGNSPQALVNRTDVKVDLDFVILHITIYPTFRCILIRD
jgi:hypothetical protein